MFLVIGTQIIRGCYVMFSIVMKPWGWFWNDDIEKLVEELYSTVLFYRVAKFNGVTSLLAYFPTNYGAETTKIYYIGLRGDFTQVKQYTRACCAYCHCTATHMTCCHDTSPIWLHIIIIIIMSHCVLPCTLNIVSLSFVRLQDPVLW